MTQLRNGLVVGIAVVVVVRMGAWLLEPVLPLLVALFVVAAVLTWLVRPYSGRRRWR